MWRRFVVCFIAMRSCISFFFVLVFVVLGFSAHADQLFAENSLWRWAEARTGVPAEKIYGIALQESGMRWQDGKVRPWPWTINSPKTGPMRFNSKKEAYEKIKELVKQGVYNIDLGMMQINLRHHWARVNGKDVLEPSVNIALSAEILREAMVSAGGDVPKAVGFYHTGAGGPGERGSAYTKSVERFEVAITGRYNGLIVKRRG